MYARYLWSAPLSLAFNLLTMLLSPLLAALAATFKWQNLPGPLSYFQTHDNWVYGSGWPKPDVPPTWVARFRIATWWLLRNPGYTFDAYVLGFPAEGMQKRTVSESGTLYGGRNKAHRLIHLTAANGARLFCYQQEIPVSESRYMKIWLGWHHSAQAERHMLKLDFHPYKRKA